MRYCFVATCFCVYHSKILLVKHKKLGIWLAPGGHIEPNELPHVAALRELQEETGINGRIFSSYPVGATQVSENLPMPFSLNLHPIHHGSCDHHLAFNYLATPVGKPQIVVNHTETDAVNWFSQAEITGLETTTDVKAEIVTALKFFNL